MLKLTCISCYSPSIKQTSKETFVCQKCGKRYELMRTETYFMFAEALFEEKDYEKSIILYRKAAEKGYLRAQKKLGFIYTGSEGVTRDLEEAKKWLLLAANQGDAEAQHNLGTAYSWSNDQIQANYWYLKAASAGNAWAQNALAQRLYYGKGVEKNDSEAFRWAKKSADQGCPSGEITLGYFYDFGIGTQKNKFEAVKWYRKAADKGETIAMRNLAQHYLNGTGVDKSEAEALRWCTEAANRGDAEAGQELEEIQARKTDKWIKENERRKKEEQGKVEHQRKELGKDTILFGKYKQRVGGPKEPIEWIVLRTEGHRALVISKYILDYKPYYKTSWNWEHESAEHYHNRLRSLHITWENSTIRKWLNSTFLRDAFSWSERKRIITTHVLADKNPYYDTPQGDITDDKVFLLSVVEADKLFGSDADRKTLPTAYAKSQTELPEGSNHWMLRTLGNDALGVAGIRSNGENDGAGGMIDNGWGPVRPAMWIQLGL